MFSVPIRLIPVIRGPSLVLSPRLLLPFALSLAMLLSDLEPRFLDPRREAHDDTV